MDYCQGAGEKGGKPKPKYRQLSAHAKSDLTRDRLLLVVTTPASRVQVTSIDTLHSHYYSHPNSTVLVTSKSTLLLQVSNKSDKGLCRVLTWLLR